MLRTPHLFVALSGHGFGHLAMTAPVLNALRRRLPALRLTVQCSLPEAVLKGRIEGDFTLIPEAADFGMRMASAVEVRVEESLAAYRDFHRDWDLHLDRQIALLQQFAPDVLFANIPYLPLAAAARLEIPSLALCSLNWADILRGCCPSAHDLKALTKPMLDAYNSAAAFLQPTPSMPMPDLSNTRSIGPIAGLGRDRRSELNARLGLRGDETLALVSLGGFDLRLPVERWPAAPDVRWIIPQSWQVERPDFFYWEALTDIPFPNLLRSCEVFLTKPGYGSFTESVCNGRRVLYTDRGDWPEEPWLVRWLEENGNGVRIARHRLETGNVLEPLRELLARPPKPVLEPSGIGEAADCLSKLVGHPRHP